MGDEGLEPTAKSPRHQPISETGGAESGAAGARNGPVDVDLAPLIDVWPGLSADVKRTILRLVESTPDAGE